MKRAHVVAALGALAALGILIMLLRPRSAELEVAAPAAAPADQKTRGAYLARAGNCMGCHTAPGGQPYAGGLRLATPFGVFVTPNITPDAETGLGRWSAQDFRRALHEGKSPDGRPYYPAFPYTEYTKVSSSDSDAIFAYLQNIAAITRVNEPNRLDFPYNIRALMYLWRALYFESGSYRPKTDHTGEWNRGAYLVEGLGHCNACHASRNALGATRGAALGGGQIEGLNWYAPSLTSAVEAGTRDWPVEDIVQLLATGISPRGVASGPMAGVVRQSLQYLSNQDLAAIAVYLKSLPGSSELQVEEEVAASEEVQKAHEQGGKLYDKHCADCHGASGQGVSGVYPPLAGNRGVTLTPPLNAIRSVLHGGYPPSTAGNPRPFGMPPFAQVLSDAQVALILSYVRNAWGNRGSRITDVQVDRSRGSDITGSRE